MSDERVQLLAEFTEGWTELRRRQLPLLVQVRAMLTALKSPSGEPGSGGKPKTKPPCNLNVLDLYYECLAEVNIVRQDSEHDLSTLQGLRNRCRNLLGYDAPMMNLPSVVCHTCGGPLIVAADASSAVTCAERCGTEYPTSTWIDLLAAKQEDEES